MKRSHLTITVEIAEEDAVAYWKAGMLPNDTMNALARGLDRARPLHFESYRPARTAAAQPILRDLFADHERQVSTDTRR